MLHNVQLSCCARMAFLFDTLQVVMMDNLLKMTVTKMGGLVSTRIVLPMVQ